MKRIRVSLRERSYDILIGRGLIKQIGQIVARRDIGVDAVIITNKKLNALYGRIVERSLRRARFSVCTFTVPDTEEAKSLAVATGLLHRLAAYDALRRIFVVALGGGVTGDLAGFVAAIYKRGVPYIQVPTSLLAQVDSSIGGKVAVDLPHAKNLAGAFYQPRLVVADTDVVGSLPPRQLRTGLAEVIKYGVIKDPTLFAYLEKNAAKILRGDAASLEPIIARSGAIKAAVVAQDEYDRTGLRAILNYGHTFGHAIEAAAGYRNTYTHGEAIAIGMVIAADIAVRMGILRPGDALRIGSLIRRYGLPTTARALMPTAIYTAYLRDKKFINRRNRFVLPVKIGAVRIVEGVPEALVRAALKTHLVR